MFVSYRWWRTPFKITIIVKFNIFCLSHMIDHKFELIWLIFGTEIAVTQDYHIIYSSQKTMVSAVCVKQETIQTKLQL